MRKVILLVVMCCTLNVVAENRIVGRLLIESNSAYLEGGIIKIESLNTSVVSGENGRFVFNDVPAGVHELKASYLGYAPHTVSVTVTDDAESTVDVALKETIEEMVIYGQASSTAKALNQQRTQDTLASILSSDEFGQLPDANLSEALQRIPGVFLDRDQGEGRFVGIRGIDPGLNSTKINGVNIPSPDNDTRAVALDVIPSELLETLIVRKSFTPDMDPEGVGGAIEVKSFSAFDHKGKTFRIKSEMSNNTLEDEVSPKISGRYSQTFDTEAGSDTLGVAVALSWYDRQFGSDNTETDGGWPNDLETEDGSEFKGAEEIEQRNYVINRERFGSAVNLGFQANPNHRLFLRTLMSRFSDQEYRTRKEFKFDKGDAIAGSATSATWDDANLERSLKDRYETQDILSIVGGGEFDNDQWEVDYLVGLSKSGEDEPDRYDTEFRIKKVQLGYRNVGEIPDLFTHADADDPAQQDIKEIVWEDNTTDDSQTSLQVDLKRRLEFANASGYVQFGGKLRRREKTNDLSITVYDGFPDDPVLSDFLGSSPVYGLGAFGPGIDVQKVRNYIETNRSSFEINQDDTFISSIVGDYSIDEDINAIYLMSKYRRDQLSLVYGVRYESTDSSSRGNAVVLDDVNDEGIVVRPLTDSRSYSSILPSVNLRYAFSDDLILRSGWYATVARPSFGKLKPGGEVEFEQDDGENEFKAEIGNPLLDPIESSNFDLSLERYDQGIGLLAGGLFYKRIDNFVVLADQANSIDLTPFVGVVPVHEAEVIQPINGETATILGVELTWTKKFNGLPHPWNGLLLTANATMSDSEATLELRDTTIPMPRQADTVYNLILGYESDRISFRVASNYKSDTLLALEDPGDPNFDIYQSDHNQYDMSLKFFFNDNWLVFFDGNNLGDEPYYAYFSDPRYNAQYEQYGRSFSMGLQYKL